jgi:hypothetical protein
MGLLDDAIREHLELMRRHGADPEEVSRQEREALGSARGGGEFARAEGDEAPEADATEVAATPAGVDGPTEVDAGELGDDAEDPFDGARPAAPTAPFDVDEDGTESRAPAGYEEDPWLDEERDEVPAEEALDPPPANREDSEDVLEETPDFLQETPEHDRLWFEQRPPRDFDWDK